MVSEEIELIAEIQGVDLEELIDRRTHVTPEELRETAHDHFRSLVGEQYDPEESRYNRAELSSLTKGTYLQREHAVEQFIEWFEEHDKEHITSENVEAFLKHAREVDGYAGSTMESRYWQLISFVTESDLNVTIENQFREADHTKYTKSNPLIEPKAGQGARTITREEKEKLVEEATTKRLEIAIRIMWQCGLRAQEVCNLKVDQVNLEENLLEDVVTAKRDGDTRTLRFNWILEQELRKWIKAEREQYTQAENSPYLLPTHKSEKQYPQNLAKTVGDLAERAGIQTYGMEYQNGNKRREVTPHSLRKAFGRNRLDEGKNIREVQKLLGHSDLQSLAVYLEIDSEEIDYEPR